MTNEERPTGHIVLKLGGVGNDGLEVGCVIDIHFQVGGQAFEVNAAAEGSVDSQEGDDKVPKFGVGSPVLRIPSFDPRRLQNLQRCSTASTNRRRRW